MIEGIKRVLNNVEQEGESFSLTKLCVLTDGVSYDEIDQQDFYENILSNQKLLGFSCNIILTCSSQAYLNEYGFIVDDNNIRKLAQRMNGQFHRAILQ